MLRQCIIGVSIIVLGTISLSLANPQDYAEFAQHKVQDSIPIQYVQAPTVKQHLEDKTPQVIIDVRSAASHANQHLPGALSIPLRQLPERVAEVPRDVPVVLY